MSTVPPPLPAVLPPLGDELPLLLHPAAAKAITARAAIPVVRFIILIFLSFDRGSSRCREAQILAASGCLPRRQLRDGRVVTKSLCAAEPGWRSPPIRFRAGRTSPRATWPEACSLRGDTQRHAAGCGRVAASSLRSGRPGIERACQSPVSPTPTAGNEAIKD